MGGIRGGGSALPRLSAAAGRPSVRVGKQFHDAVAPYKLRADRDRKRHTDADSADATQTHAPLVAPLADERQRCQHRSIDSCTGRVAAVDGAGSVSDKQQRRNQGADLSLAWPVEGCEVLNGSVVVCDAFSTGTALKQSSGRAQKQTTNGGNRKKKERGIGGGGK